MYVYIYIYICIYIYISAKEKSSKLSDIMSYVNVVKIGQNAETILRSLQIHAKYNENVM